MRTKAVGPLEYYIMFSRCRTPLSDFYVGTARMDIHILGAWGRKGEAAGFLLYEQKEGFAEILCLECTGSAAGAKERLLEDFLALGRKLSFERILFRLMADSAKYPELKDLVERNGFALKKKMYLFRSDKEGYLNWKSYRRQHGERMLRFLEEEGFRAMSFDEAPARMIREAACNPTGRFDKALDPAGIIGGKKGPFSPQISHLSVKDEELAAYCLVTNPGRGQYIFEVISAAEEYQDTGVIFQSFCLAADALENFPYKRIVFAMDEGNKKAMVLSKRIMKALIRHTGIQYNYEYDCKA